MRNIIFSEPEAVKLRELILSHPHPTARRSFLTLLLKSQNIPHATIAQIT